MLQLDICQFKDVLSLDEDDISRAGIIVRRIFLLGKAWQSDLLRRNVKTIFPVEIWDGERMQTRHMVLIFQEKRALDRQVRKQR